MRRALGLSLLLFVAAAGACSSGDDRAAPETTTTAAPTTATTAAAVTTTTRRPTTTTTARPAAARAPVAANDPAGLARQIAQAEGVIRASGASARDLAAGAHLEQVGYRQLVRHPEWLAQVVGLVPAPLRAVVQDNVAAGSELGKLLP